MKTMFGLLAVGVLVVGCSTTGEQASTVSGDGDALGDGKSCRSTSSICSSRADINVRASKIQIVIVGGYCCPTGKLKVPDSTGIRIGSESEPAQGDEIIVDVLGETQTLILDNPLASLEGHENAGGSLSAPMPGRVAQVLVKSGDTVTTGDPLMVLEAMKMEHSILSPIDGVVDAVFFAQDDRVEEGVTLLSLS